MDDTERPLPGQLKMFPCPCGSVGDCDSCGLEVCDCNSFTVDGLRLCLACRGAGGSPPDRPKAVAASLPPEARTLLRLCNAAGGALLGQIASPAPSLAAVPAVRFAVMLAAAYYTTNGDTPRRLAAAARELELTPATFGRAVELAHEGLAETYAWWSTLPWDATAFLELAEATGAELDALEEGADDGR